MAEVIKDSDDEEGETWTHPLERTKTEPINFKEEIGQALLDGEYVGSHREPDNSVFRASSTGYCKRQILFNKMSVKAPGVDGLGRFKIGDWIHEWVQSEVLPKHMTKHENEVTYEQDGITLKGHYDAFDGDVVYDFKSRSSWYRFSGDVPIQRHLDQLNTYMGALGIDYGMMVYISKKDLSVDLFPDYFGEADEHSSPHKHLVKYSQERMDHVIQKCKEVKEYLDEHGYPRTEDEIPYDKCGDNDDERCIGCVFEDSDKKEFSRFWDYYTPPEERDEDDNFKFRR